MFQILSRLTCILMLCRLSLCGTVTAFEETPEYAEEWNQDFDDKQGAHLVNYAKALDILRKHSKQQLEPQSQAELPDKVNLVDILRNMDPESTIDQNEIINNERIFDYIRHKNDFVEGNDIAEVEKRRFDSISGISEFGGLGKRAFDSIGGNSAFGGLGKRAFDSIGGNSAFGGLGKRAFDSIGGNSAFGGFGKRAFDSIEGLSDFGGFGKRSHNGVYTPVKEEKRGFDSINHFSDFGGFGKRSFDEFNYPDTKEKRRFDSIDHFSDFGGFGKRSSYNDLIEELSPKSKRAFDRIGHLSAFGGFGKRSTRDREEHPSYRANHGYPKRAFDSISYTSSFGGFGEKRSV